MTEKINAQTKIAALVQQSFALKAESETLLDLAKRAVEMAIEEDEAAAMEFLTGKNKTLWKSLISFPSGA